MKIKVTRMAKCECGRELEDGETKCPCCQSKSDSLVKKIFSGIAFVAVLAFGAAVAIVKKNNNG